ncbi:MAG: ABC transporter substrate-binding protein [Alphaproteobacteria bacterium]
MRRFAARLAVALALATPAPVAAQSVTIALGADIRSSNPGVNRDDATDGVMLHVVEGLVGYREDGSVGPLLARAIEVSPDGRTYTFRLRQGVRFHNGAPMTAEDVVWSWRRYLDPKTAWWCIATFDGRNGPKVEAVEAVEAPDPATVVMRLAQPNPLFLTFMAQTDCAQGAVLHRDSVNANGSWKEPIGTGPFRLAEWRRGELVHLSRFAEYASPEGGKRDGYVGRKEATIEEVRFLVVPDLGTVKAALTRGTIDIANVPESEAQEFADTPRTRVVATPVAVRRGFLLQTQDPLLSDVRIRRAIAMSLDIDELVAATSSGFSKPNASAIHPQSPYWSEVQARRFPHDPARARALLKEAGYRGQRIVISTDRRPTVPTYNMAVIAQAMMAAVGFDVGVEVVEWGTSMDRYNTGRFQMLSFSYSSRMDPALAYEQFSGPKARTPRKVWDDPEVERMIAESAMATDKAERQRIFDALHLRMLDSVPLIPLYNGVDVRAVNKRIDGFAPWEFKPRFWGVTAR